MHLTLVSLSVLLMKLFACVNFVGGHSEASLNRELLSVDTVKIMFAPLEEDGHGTETYYSRFLRTDIFDGAYDNWVQLRYI